MPVHRFETVLDAEGSGVYFEVPLDVPAEFGKARAPVRGTINGQPFRGTVAVYGGRYYLPVNRALREAAGVAAGDAVVVELEADDQPRTVDPPPDLADALAADPEAKVAFAGLSYTHQREYAEWVAEARRAATRGRRVAQTVQMLRDGRRHP
ncbi:MAG TPA: YdeI/OmpD-associated family protein [Actinomycetota bacterium]|nr:YdeI/OmpD-associated family protein [Actinomycetota bacterium]